MRHEGSGNIGATNVLRIAGWRLGAATLVGDALKGALPVLVADRLDPDPITAALTGLAAFAGHVFPIALRFAGGKGVATAAGVVGVLCPAALLIALGAFALFLACGRVVSVASLAAAATAPIAMVLLDCPPAHQLVGTIMAGAIAFRHRENLRRLLAGTEPRLDLHKRQAPPGT